MSVIVSGLSKAKVLAALYNASSPRGMGFLEYNPKPMTEEQAEGILKKGTYFDYVYGRVLKVDLTSDDDFDEKLYDRDNGRGAAQMVIDQLRTTGSVDKGVIGALHKRGKSEGARRANELADKKSFVDESDNSITLGADEAGPRLKDAVKKAIG